MLLDLNAALGMLNLRQQGCDEQAKEFLPKRKHRFTTSQQTRASTLFPPFTQKENKASSSIPSPQHSMLSAATLPAAVCDRNMSDAICGDTTHMVNHKTVRWQFNV